MAKYGLRVTRMLSEFTGNRQQGIRIRIEITDVAAFPTKKLFRYKMADKNPQTGARVGIFDGVASPSDIVEFPEDEPQPDADPQWFLLDYVDVLLPSRTTALEFWDDVVEDLNGLVLTYETMERFTEVEEFVIGLSPANSSSSSSSSA